MPTVPTKRLLVYIALGLVVLAVGVIAVVSMGGGGSATGGGVTIVDEGAGGQGGAAGAAEVGAAGAHGPSASETGASSTSSTVSAIFVQVAGAVRRPGVYQMTDGSRVFQAIEKAGGFIEGADEEAVSLAAQISDGCRVYVPVKGEVTIPPVSVTGATSVSGSTGEPVSINTATMDELDSLPGVGPSTAQKIIAYREANGPFTSVDQLTEVPGIGPSKLEELRPLVGL